VSDVGDDVHQLAVVDETSSLVRPHGCTIDVAVNVMRDTVAHAVGDVASFAQAVMRAMQEADVGDVYLPARHVITSECHDPETNRVTAHVATYQFAIVISDFAALPQTLTEAVSGAAQEPAQEPAQQPAQEPALSQSDALPLEIETRTEVIDLTKARVGKPRREPMSSSRLDARVGASFGSLRWSARALEDRTVYIPHSST
jgi:hypothetical protein